MEPSDEDFAELEDALAKGGDEADIAVVRFLIDFNYVVVRCVRTGAIFAVQAEKRVLH